MTKGAVTVAAVAVQSTVVLKVTENFSAEDVSDVVNSESAAVATVPNATLSPPNLDETLTSSQVMRLKLTRQVSRDEDNSSKLSGSHRARDFKLSALSKQVSNATSLYESSYTGLNSIDDESSSVLGKKKTTKKKKFVLFLFIYAL